MNSCPQRAIETAHGLATVIIILFSAANARLFIWIIDTLGIYPEAWWWKVLSQFIGIGIMVLVAATVYMVMHYVMGFKPLNYLVRYTSLTAFPFWRRYKYLMEKIRIKLRNNNS